MAGGVLSAQSQKGRSLSADVIVYGGSPAGLAAARAAVRDTGTPQFVGGLSAEVFDTADRRFAGFIRTPFSRYFFSHSPERYELLLKYIQAHLNASGPFPLITSPVISTILTATMPRGIVFSGTTRIIKRAFCNSSLMTIASQPNSGMRSRVGGCARTSTLPRVTGPCRCTSAKPGL